MAFHAVLDACVLYPFSLRDLLLRLAERELYDVYWSDRILAEMSRNLIDDNLMDGARAEHLVDQMNGTFDAAAVAAGAIDQLEPVMTNHQKDRHVLAAAVIAHAETVVTTNLKDFAQKDCEPLGVTAIHPDEFLTILHAKQPDIVLQVLTEQASDLKKPPRSLDELLDMLAKQAPRFVAAVRAYRS